MSEGWIKLHRKLQDNPLWSSEPFTRGQAWVDLILLANHECGYIYVRDHKINLKRGDVGWSQNRLSQRWQWSRTKVRKFLNDLEKEQQVKQIKSKSYTVIRLINYKDYQKKKVEKTTAEQQKNKSSTTERQQKDTNKNEKNVKNEKNIPPEISDVKDWLIENKELPEGTSKEVAEEFYSFYEMKGWKVGKNKMQDWKIALGRSLKWDSMKNIIENKNGVRGGGLWN